LCIRDRDTTVLGPVQVTRAWYHCRQCGHGTAPRDDELRVAVPGLAEMTARRRGGPVRQGCRAAGRPGRPRRDQPDLREVVARIRGLDGQGKTLAEIAAAPGWRCPASATRWEGRQRGGVRAGARYPLAGLLRAVAESLLANGFELGTSTHALQAVGSQVGSHRRQILGYARPLPAS
jgi:hypothetical protein